MTDDSTPPVPERLAKWRSEGETVELTGRQMWYHDSGPKTDDAVFIVHGFPDLMARFEEGRTPFRIRHAILLDGSTLIDMIQMTPSQRAALAAPSTALAEELDWETINTWPAPEAYATESQARDDFDELITCQAHQIYINQGSRVVGSIAHYLNERQETFGRWSRTLFEFHKAPLTLIWGEQDPVALIAMAAAAD